jgi:hypothetical protein
MGRAGDKPRKPRRRLAKVPRGFEPNDLHLAGLNNPSGGNYGTRDDHDAASYRSTNLGRFGRAILWLLGRRKREQVDPNTGADSNSESE